MRVPPSRSDMIVTTHRSRGVTTTGARSTVRWWVAISLVGALVSACTGHDEKGVPDPPETAQAALGTPFDPPLSFDSSRAVTLTDGDDLDGVLHDTTFYRFTEGTLRSVDLTTGKMRWTADLSHDSEQYYLGSVLVLDDIVVVPTAERPPHEKYDDMFTVNVFGVDAMTGEVVWDATTGLQISVIGGLEPHAFSRAVLAAQDGGVLVAFDPNQAHIPTFLVDGEPGGTRWAYNTQIWATTGPYAVSYDTSYQDTYLRGYTVSVFDLRTGQVVERLEDFSTSLSLHLDPSGDESRVVVKIMTENSVRYLRFSSTDGTTEPFVPAEGDIRYQEGITCTREADQSVALCDDHDGRVYGVAAASGEVIWAYDGMPNDVMHNPVQYHGNIYGILESDTTYSVVSLDNGEMLGRTPLAPLAATASFTQQVMVNQYGMVGRLDGTYVWVPSSG